MHNSTIIFCYLGPRFMTIIKKKTIFLLLLLYCVTNLFLLLPLRHFQLLLVWCPDVLSSFRNCLFPLPSSPFVVCTSCALEIRIFLYIWDRKKMYFSVRFVSKVDITWFNVSIQFGYLSIIHLHPPHTYLTFLGQSGLDVLCALRMHFPR